MRSRNLAAIMPLVLMLAACVPPAPQPTPTPAPGPTSSPVVQQIRPPVAAPQPAPPASSNWMDAPATPGDWFYRDAGAERIAEFRSPAGGQIFQVTCTQRRDITLTVIARAPNANALTIRTEHGDRAVSATGGENSVSAVLAASDTLLDWMAFSKGRLSVEVAGGSQLFLPAWPEVTRVIEDCRG